MPGCRSSSPVVVKPVKDLPSNLGLLAVVEELEERVDRLECLCMHQHKVINSLLISDSEEESVEDE